MTASRVVQIVRVLLCFAAVSTSILAADITGEIVIKRKLTKRTVTSSASAYYRGPAIEATPISTEDPLAFERQHVVIYIEGAGPTEPVSAVLTQENRRFEPDLIVVPVGSTVRFPNRDLVFHNVFSLSKSKSFDLGNYPRDQTRTVTFSRPGVVFVNCHLHPNMSAAIVVTPNAWFTRADDKGRFRFPHLPPGRYTVTAWHKTGGAHKKMVEVKDGADSTVSFLIPFADDGSLIAAAGH